MTGLTLNVQQEYQIGINCVVWPGSDVLIAPTRYTAILNPQDYDMRVTKVSRTGTMKLGYRTVEVQYYPDSYVLSGTSRDLLGHLHNDDYQALLAEASEILKDTDPDAAALLLQAEAEAADAQAYLAEANAGDYRPEIVDTLSAELTEGLTSDLEKAIAIEQYFKDESFVYDLSYNKPEGENVADFLQTTRRGVCWEYATAMTMLCRSAGLPTRMTTGYNLSEMYKSAVRFQDGSSWDTNYVIKARDSHAFPEVYISGYGWVSFEPTIASDALEDNTAENLNVMRYGFIMLGIALIVFLIWLLMPMIREKQFRRSLQKLTAEEGASAIFCRMRKILKKPDSTTVNEVAAASAPFFDEPELYAALDRKLYSTEPAASPAETAEAYIRWQEAQKQYAKEQKRLAREQRRAARLARKTAK